MDRVRNPNPGGLGSDEWPVGHPHFLLSPYNPADHEHNSDLLDTYERERISRELQYYVEATAKSISDVKFNEEIGSDHQNIGHRSFQRGMSMPRLPLVRDTSGNGGEMMKKKISEKKSKEIMEVSRMPPGRGTSGGDGGMKKKKRETKSKEIKDVSRPERDTRNGGGGGDDCGMKKKKSETKSKEIIDVSRPERDTRNGGGGGDGGMKKKSETKSKEIIDVSRPDQRDIRNGSGGGGGGMKKKSTETKSKKVSMPEGNQSGDGGMKKKSTETKSKAMIEGNLSLKHAPMVCNSSQSDVVKFGRDFNIRGQVAAGRRLPGKDT